MPHDVMDEPPYRFMTAAQLEAERAAIAVALPRPGTDHDRALDQHDQLAHGARFADLASFAEPPSAVALRDALAPLGPKKSMELMQLLLQIRAALSQIPHWYGQDFDPTDLFVVSPLWFQRWQDLIGGVLFPAYIGFVRTERFASNGSPDA